MTAMGMKHLAIIFYRIVDSLYLCSDNVDFGAKLLVEGSPIRAELLKHLTCRNTVLGDFRSYAEN